MATHITWRVLGQWTTIETFMNDGFKSEIKEKIAVVFNRLKEWDDWQKEESTINTLIDERAKYGKNSPEYEGYTEAINLSKEAMSSRSSLFLSFDQAQKALAGV